MKLPSMIKGWFNPATTPEILFSRYLVSGDAKHVEPIVHQFNRSIFHYLLSQTDYATAQDITQTTWLKFINLRLKANINYDQPNAIRNLLYCIARNSLIDEKRKQKHSSFTPLPEALTNNENLSQHLDNEQQLSRFNNIVNELSLEQKEAFIMQMDGFSIMAISEITGDLPETIKSRIRYAKQTIKQKMEQIS